MACPISQPLKTTGVGHSWITLRALGTSIFTLYSQKCFAASSGVNAPAMIDSSLTFCFTSDLPSSGELPSGFESKSRAKFVEKPTWTITTEPSGRPARVLPQQTDGLGRIGAAGQVVRVAGPAVVARRGELADVLVVLGRHAVADGPDGNPGSAIEGIDQIDARSGVRVVFRHRDRQQFALAAVGQGMDHGQGHGVVHIISEVRVEDHGDGFRASFVRRSHAGQREHRRDDRQQSPAYGAKTLRAAIHDRVLLSLLLGLMAGSVIDRGAGACQVFGRPPLRVEPAIGRARAPMRLVGCPSRSRLRRHVGVRSGVTWRGLRPQPRHPDVEQEETE